MIIGGICPSLEIWGGVRRYLSLDAFIDLGHDYTFYYDQFTRKPWIDFKGKLCKISEAPDIMHDILFTGAKESFKDLLRMKAKIKVVMVVSNYYTDDYINLWRNGGDKFLWIGVSHGWQNQFKNVGIDGFTCPGGVDTKFFHPDYSKRSKDILRCSFYGKKYSKDRLDYDYVIKEVNRFNDKYGDKLIEFIAYDSESIYYPNNNIKVQVNKTQEDLLNTVQSSHILISVKKYGRWNNNAVEALSCGVPVICFPEETVDFMKDKVTGRLLQGDIGIVEALEWFLEDRDRIIKCGQTGRENVLQFSWDKYAKHFLEIVNKWNTNFR